jgi:hypothetical protein
VAKEVVKAVQKGRRHVRLPKRSVHFAMLVEVPNRLVHHAEVLTLTGDSYRGLPDLGAADFVAASVDFYCPQFQ